MPENKNYKAVNLNRLDSVKRKYYSDICMQRFGRPLEYIIHDPFLGSSAFLILDSIQTVLYWSDYGQPKLTEENDNGNE